MALGCRWNASIHRVLFLAAIWTASLCSSLAALAPNNNNKSEIYRTIRELEQFPLKKEYTSTTRRVLRVLRQWACDEIIMTNWRSVVNKANLRHEVEESIVALHHLRKWQVNNEEKDYMAVDACCGKGMFSLLLSYMAPRAYPGLQQIVLFDKDPNIDWTHIHEANQSHESDGRPFMQLWAGTNLHEHDEIVTKLAAFQSTMAITITGIHLCKTLSPALVGIANAVQANYLCVAPCCLPRPSQLLSIPQYETPMQRNARLEAVRFEKRAKERRRSRCYVCTGDHHVKDCPEKSNYASDNEWNRVVEESLLALPCWNCGKTGHRRKDCTEQVELREIPYREISMPSLSKSPKLFEDYCRLLSQCIEDSSPRIVDSGLVSSSSQTHGSNWNSDLKAIFIVAP